MTIPVALFAYARPSHLTQVLACLRANRVPEIYAFSDGPKSEAVAPRVAEVRHILRGIDWCDVHLVERTDNLGLGASIRAGVTDVLARHEAVVVFEDDLVCVDGTYEYLACALRHYASSTNVMSVTGWTHPRITPADVTDQPYFDGRAECWVWGTWRRAWQGMDADAATLIRRCSANGIDPYRYGADLVDMARAEHERNIWAVRFLYLHMANRGLCLRPPRSLVEHIGVDAGASNAEGSLAWANAPLQSCPPLPEVWPQPVEHPACAKLARAAFGEPPRPPSAVTRFRQALRPLLRARL